MFPCLFPNLRCMIPPPPQGDMYVRYLPLSRALPLSPALVFIFFHPTPRKDASMRHSTVLFLFFLRRRELPVLSSREHPPFNYSLSVFTSRRFTEFFFLISVELSVCLVV